MTPGPALAYLGPPGTYTEAATIGYGDWLARDGRPPARLCPYPSIGQTLKAAAAGEVPLAVVPVENSIQGSVAATLDALWQLGNLFVQQALELPIAHVLLSNARSLDAIRAVYSHPQALGQCQRWLNDRLPGVQTLPTSSTTEALARVKDDPTLAAISSQRAAHLYQLTAIATDISDYPENHTRFWVLGVQPPSGQGRYTSLAFALPANVPGALLEPLRVLADRQINLCRIESRPTRRSFGDYLFFVDFEGATADPKVASAMTELKRHAETVKIFGSYGVLPLALPATDESSAAS